MGRRIYDVGDISSRTGEIANFLHEGNNSVVIRHGSSAEKSYIMFNLKRYANKYNIADLKEIFESIKDRNSKRFTKMSIKAHEQKKKRK